MPRCPFPSSFEKQYFPFLRKSSTCKKIPFTFGLLSVFGPVTVILIPSSIFFSQPKKGGEERGKDETKQICSNSFFPFCLFLFCVWCFGV
mmetsp:Transcript_2858/g.3790  ORF Transcript_2858/g.3790 Transcript_2858/m.3790 type:complete len:90 (+) Transcript_2858:134-403(+)